MVNPKEVVEGPTKLTHKNANKNFISREEKVKDLVGDVARDFKGTFLDMGMSDVVPLGLQIFEFLVQSSVDPPMKTLLCPLNHLEEIGAASISPSFSMACSMTGKFRPPRSFLLYRRGRVL